MVCFYINSFRECLHTTPQILELIYGPVNGYFPFKASPLYSYWKVYINIFWISFCEPHQLPRTVTEIYIIHYFLQTTKTDKSSACNLTCESRINSKLVTSAITQTTLRTSLKAVCLMLCVQWMIKILCTYFSFLRLKVQPLPCSWVFFFFNYQSIDRIVHYFGSRKFKQIFTSPNLK